jgi:streptogramin lyase
MWGRAGGQAAVWMTTGLMSFLGVLCCGFPSTSGATPSTSTAVAGLGYSLTPSETEPYAACPQPTPERAECMAIVVPPAAAPTSSLKALPGQPFSPAQSSLAPGPSLEGSGEGGGLAPSDLASAYRLPATGGSGQTVAIVDAYNDPNAEKDLKVYREHYKLGECTEGNGCFKKVNQAGETKNYPAGNSEWGEEISLDLDMVSAVCPSCHILLVEAANEGLNAEGILNLDIAENEAATLKATEISNSWAFPEHSGETTEDKYFEHPGIPITAAAGDHGYRVEYPAASKNVIAVGGTTLYKTPFYERGWFEQAWADTGGGCSAYELKPPWQVDTGCAHRTDSDVAAIADPRSPVSMYDTYELEGGSGWMLVGGTSVATPIVAGIEALSSSTVRSEGAATFYKHTESLFDVTTGYNWGVREKVCSPEYLCVAERGYDGPTGNGTPDIEGGGSGSLDQWSTTSIPGPRNIGQSVSCTSASACVEVGAEGGYGDGYPSAHSWNGTEWSSMGQGAARPSNGTEVTLSGVSCTETSACVAVGHYINSASVEVTLAESWNGTEWSVKSTPNPTGAKASSLFGVSCTTSAACTAVGQYNNSSGTRVTLVERWNGTEWSIQSTPNPSGSLETKFVAVSCSSASACSAVGEYRQSTYTTLSFAEGWNGTEWKEQAIPNPGETTGSKLTGISCTAASACTAVGWYIGSRYPGTLMERWNGTEWNLQTVANPSNSSETLLDTVSCTSSSSCEAAGRFCTSPCGEAALLPPLAEHWNGTTWSVQELPVGGGAENKLESVSCISSTVCMAAGTFPALQYFPYASLNTNLTYSLSGTKWSLGTVPDAGTDTAVSCASSSACAAVGKVGGEGEGISNMWNGGAWSTLPVERPSGAGGIGLSGVSCGSPGECAAVGSYTNSGGSSVTLAELSTKPKDGEQERWSVKSTPNPSGAKASALAGVSCVSVGACTAVGSYTNSAGVVVTLAEVWNGTEWKEQSTPSPSGAKASSLAGVSCVSVGACTAVGSYTNSAGVVVTLAEVWNGTTWSIQTSINPTGAKASSLEAVSCTSSSMCVAVGSNTNSAGVVVTLAEIWNGAEWAIQTTTNVTGATTSVLKGVSCKASSLCLAVGYSTDASSLSTDLSEVFSGLVIPIVVTKPATSVAKTGATLNGSVNPKSLETKYSFEYGTTTSYGTKTAEASAGSGASPVEENKAITGLTPGTNYHYRIVATNSDGTASGNDQVFSTPPNAPENMEPPVVSPATPDQAVPESSTTGTWTNAPTSYAYQWERCNASGVECVNISGAVSSTYTPVEADVEDTLVLKLTAKNSGGEGSALSKATNQVMGIGRITEYALPSGSGPIGIAAGPDGNLWFSEERTNKVGKITTAGTVTEYSLPAESDPYGIAAGPAKENDLWFTNWGTSKIGKITTTGTVTEYSLPSFSRPEGIVAGPDGDLWFSDLGTSKIGKITTAGTITEYSLPESSDPEQITAGPDGNLWFTEWGTSKIGKITTSGVVTAYALPAESYPYGITMGPEKEDLWFTDRASGQIGKITTSGAITEYPASPMPLTSHPRGIGAGPDGNLWFTDESGTIGRITTTGTVTQYSLPSGSESFGISAGPDDNLWFTNWVTNKIGKITP